MPKPKTVKAAAKRFHVTGGKNIMKRTAGQAHFNSRESSKVTRNKRSDEKAHTTLNRVLHISLPHQF
jgi:ribosomal protein L35